MRLLLLGLAIFAGDVIAQGFVRAPSAPLLPVSSFASFPVRPVQAPIRTIARPVSNFNRVVPQGNPCGGNPCGPNTRCTVGRSGYAECRCINDYVPNDNTIEGCRPQCIRDSECPDDYMCRREKCHRVCGADACGFGADCRPRNHRAQCSCPDGYGGSGDAGSNCRRIKAEVRVVEEYDIDPCVPSPCGDNANCRVRGDRPVCSCPEGYEGDPLRNCIQGECIRHSDCPGHLACQGLRCIDPCVGVCGEGAECETKNNQPICSCPRGNTGNPFQRCRRITEDDVCNPSPCGQNTNCRAQSDRSTGLLRAVCSCIDNYIGTDPINQGCRPECVRDSECDFDQHCRDNRCRNPCVDGCGVDAYCDVRNHQAVCRCHEFAKGNPRDRCYFECTKHEDCSSDRACVDYECVDPCTNACGESANCKTENHTPVCSCASDMTGDPFIRCRKFNLDDLCADDPCGTNADCTPGKDKSNNDRPVCTCPHGFIGNPLVSCRRGDCTDHNECSGTEACYRFQCTSPCFYHNDDGAALSVCGRNADCSVRNHQPVCRCARGWTGDPLSECVIAPNARVAGRVAGRSGSVVVTGSGSRRYYH